MQKIIPSIIATSQDELNQRFDKIKDVGPLFHLDVMDSQFVEGSSLFWDFVLPQGEYQWQMHLMVKEPLSSLHLVKQVHTVIIHAEIAQDIATCIAEIKQLGKRVGIAINPETGVQDIAGYIQDIDLVLLMTVHPGAYGATFLPEVLPKVAQIKQLSPSTIVQIDGGINQETMHTAYESGADSFVSGSFLQHADDVFIALDILHSKCM